MKFSSISPTNLSKQQQTPEEIRIFLGSHQKVLKDLGEYFLGSQQNIPRQTSKCSQKVSWISYEVIKKFPKSQQNIPRETLECSERVNQIFPRSHQKIPREIWQAIWEMQAFKQTLDARRSFQQGWRETLISTKNFQGYTTSSKRDVKSSQVDFRRFSRNIKSQSPRKNQMFLGRQQHQPYSLQKLTKARCLLLSTTFLYKPKGMIIPKIEESYKE